MSLNLVSFDGAPLHGGNLEQAIRQYGGHADDWIDCSAALSPIAYPLPAVPASVWHRLPESTAPLLDIAAPYYGCPTTALMAVAGSQSVIQMLPLLRPRSRVGILSPTYSEHAWCWQQAGHLVFNLTLDQIAQYLDQLDVLVVVNPNNPTGHTLTPFVLKRWLAVLQARHGWLIVDEAFMDIDPSHSMMPWAAHEGLVILRSVGKFFGLAGLRLGFVAAEASLRKALTQRLGLWSVSHVALWAGQQLFADHAWQQQQRLQLRQASQWLQHTLADVGLTTPTQHPMLHYHPHPQAADWHTALAAQRIWTRWFDTPTALRFGLVAPQHHADFAARLRQAQQHLSSTRAISP